MNGNLQDPLYQQESSIDYRLLLFKFYHHWKLFAAVMVLALTVAFFFNKYAIPQYEVKTTVLVRDKSERKIDPQDLLGIGMLNNQQNLQNEIGILTSNNMVYRAITRSGFDVAYYSVDRFRLRELFTSNPFLEIARYYNGNPFNAFTERYNDAPFRVIIDNALPQPVNVRFNLTILSPYRFRLEASEEEAVLYNFSTYRFKSNTPLPIQVDGIWFFGQEIVTPEFKFKIVRTENTNHWSSAGRTWSFIFRDYDALAGAFRAFRVEPINREASIVEIKLRGTLPAKMSDFLNILTREYLARGLELKNEVATRTIAFIDSELSGISDSLGTSERDLMTFRTKKEVMNLDDEATQVFEKMMQLQDEKAALTVQTNYLRNMKQYMDNNQNLNELIVPSSMGINDPVLNSLTLQLTQLYMKRSDNIQFSTEKNPSLISIETQIAVTRSALYENVINSINSNEMAMKELNGRVAAINARINNLPETQRVLFGIERKFKLIDATYTYLLQKRSEAQITRAANLADNEVIDEASPKAAVQVFPKKSMNYLIALILGLAIPIAWILGREYFNTTIISREDVEKHTKLPVVGQVLHNSKPGNLVVITSPKSTQAEAFRTVRTNINYLVQGKTQQTILVTSDMVGAGKTFVSINLASVFALYGKRTLLMGFDLRKPKIFEDFGLTNQDGISSYLVKAVGLDNIIQHTGVANLDILMAGPIPPNPSELIASERCAEMFGQLKQRYDYIIIDTPPVGLVTDAILLTKFADANLFLIRQGVTHKKIFASVIADLESRQIANLAILINDINLEKGSYGYGYHYGYGYGYGSYGYGNYGYGYGYGYYSDDEEKLPKPNIIQRLLGKSRRRRRKK